MAIFFQLTACQKVPLSQTVKPRPEIEDHSPEQVEPQPLSLDTLMMERKPELDFLVAPEELSQDTAEL